MEQLNPNEIPEVISLLAEVYSPPNKLPTEEQKHKLSKFFMRYMGKAIEDCQNKSMSHWTMTRSNLDVAFNTKVVEVQSSGKSKVQFIVGTSYGPHHNGKSIPDFKKHTQEEVLKLYSDPDDGSWVMVFNSLMFNSINHGKFIAGLFIGARFNGDSFMPVEPVEASQEV